MIEACIVLASNFLCRDTDLKGADSLVLHHLHHLADHGYPFARARVWVWGREYVALVDRGKFYVVREALAEGRASMPLVRWSLKGIRGRAFSLSRIRERRRLLRYYGVRMEVLRRDGEVVFRFGGGGGEIGGELRGGRGEKIGGAITVEGRNLLASGVLLSLMASFDSLDMYVSVRTDVPPLYGLGLNLEGEVVRASDTLSRSALLLPYVWSYPYRFLLGGGYSGLPFVAAGVGRVEGFRYEVLGLISKGGVGYRLTFSYGWVSGFVFRGVGGWLERVGGMDRFRRLPPSGYLSGNFAVLRLDAHLLRFGRLSIGPFGDALYEEGERPLYAYGVSLRFGGTLSLFLSADGYVGFGLKTGL